MSVFHAVEWSHPAEYLQQVGHTHSPPCVESVQAYTCMNTDRQEHTMHTHTHTHQDTKSNVQTNAGKNLSHGALRYTLILPPPFFPPPSLPLILGGGRRGVTCLLLKVSKRRGESFQTPRTKVGIPISQRPTSLRPTQASQ